MSFLLPVILLLRIRMTSGHRGSVNNIYIPIFIIRRRQEEATEGPQEAE